MMFKIISSDDSIKEHLSEAFTGLAFCCGDDNEKVDDLIEITFSEFDKTISLELVFIDLLEKKAWDYVREANYSMALVVMEIAVTFRPECWQTVYRYASILSDYLLTDYLLTDFEDENKDCLFKSAQDLLFSAMINIPKESKSYMSSRNEYYYSTKQYKKQYMLGTHYVEVKGSGYSRGVGACNAAREIFKQGNLILARWYAKKGVEAFNEFHQDISDYYNSYIHYAIGLTILGRHCSAKKALKKALSISDCSSEVKEVETSFSFINRVTFWMCSILRVIK